MGQTDKGQGQGSTLGGPCTPPTSQGWGATCRTATRTRWSPPGALQQLFTSPQQPKGVGCPCPQGKGGPVASYLVTGVERGEEHEGTGAGHVERAVLRVQELRPQEPAGGHSRLGWGESRLVQHCGSQYQTQQHPAPIQPPSRTR